MGRERDRGPTVVAPEEADGHRRVEVAVLETDEDLVVDGRHDGPGKAGIVVGEVGDTSVGVQDRR
jgi:hypothetical protein